MSLWRLWLPVLWLPGLPVHCWPLVLLQRGSDHRGREGQTTRTYRPLVTGVVSLNLILMAQVTWPWTPSQSVFVTEALVLFIVLFIIVEGSKREEGEKINKKTKQMIFYMIKKIYCLHFTSHIPSKNSHSPTSSTIHSLPALSAFINFTSILLLLCYTSHITCNLNQPHATNNLCYGTQPSLYSSLHSHLNTVLPFGKDHLPDFPHTIPDPLTHILILVPV